MTTRMIHLTITEDQARYILFAVQSDAEVLNNGGFDDDDDNDEKRDAEAIEAMIDAALYAKGANNEPQ